MRKYTCILFTLLFLTLSNLRAEQSTALSNDPHYNQIGFFDIHLCNWPEQPHFFKILFSSEKYEQIKSMKVYTPDNRLLANLDKEKFKIIQRKNKPVKKVYLHDIDIPELASTGWYKIDVETKDGRIYTARDYVIISIIEKASEMQPSDDKVISLPITLKWKPVIGSQYYQAFVRDAWTEKLVFQSKLIDTPGIKIPDEKITPGGDYYWVVHSRDTNEHILLGDFHMGSLSKKTFFSVAE